MRILPDQAEMKIGGLQEWNPGAPRINPNTLKSSLGLQRLLCREAESEVTSQGEGVARPRWTAMEGRLSCLWVMPSWC